MNNGADFGLISFFDYIHLLLVAVAVVLIIIEVISKTKKIARFWRTRHIRKVWGIKNHDYVIVVCSELDDPEERQNVEPREFIYNLKYGDVDAYFEVIITLLRLYPNIKLSILSAGEAEKTRFDLARHLILIGGPDYNSITGRILRKNITQFDYRSPYVEQKSFEHPEEIVIYDKINDKEYCELTDEKDFGYFEKIKNPNNPEKQIILIGGCHTLGVTGAVKAFSMAESEQGEIPTIVLKNAQTVAKKISKDSEFSVLISAERIGQTINTPLIDSSIITVKE
ncbi:MAG: hypothetical protein Q8O04_01695 [Deltaproteobacteria bacterium]|nr:hypothetical protein [Deltaproteobacteria bacterium]